METETKIFSRKEYMDRKCSHREYYAQFVDESVRKLVASTIGIERIRKSKDEHLNDIPLKNWDTVAFNIHKGVYEKMKLAGDFRSNAGDTCILKEAARQIVEV